jgi:ribosomal protein S21
LYCDPNITSQDLDEVEKAIRRYKETMTEISQTKVETRIKRSSFFKTLQEHYDKNKNKK